MMLVRGANCYGHFYGILPSRRALIAQDYERPLLVSFVSVQNICWIFHSHRLFTYLFRISVNLPQMAILQKLVVTMALWLATTQAATAVAAQTATPVDLKVDLGYASYQGFHNQTTGLNIWRG